MTTNDTVEQAYKNGYEAGKHDAQPVHCEHCVSHDTISCPKGRVWCNHMMRYMKKDGFCSEGKESENG